MSFSQTNPRSKSAEGVATLSAWTLGSLTAVWIALILVGMLSLWSYAATPGPRTTALRRWPSETALQRSHEKPTLVMFAHPRCPCTRASMSELERIVARCRDKLEVLVVFLKPLETAAGWEEAELWRMAERIPNVRIFRDKGGVETERFQAVISGMTLLYDSDGSLAFRGGITSARGHEGDNDGRRAVVSLVETGIARDSAHPVFGCRLQDLNAAAPFAK